MRSFFLLLAASLLPLSAHAKQNDWTLSIGPGLALPVGSDEFENRTNDSLMGSLWAQNHGLGRFALEVGYDYLNLDGARSAGHYLGLGAVATLLKQDDFRSTFMLGAGFGRADDASRITPKARLGIEKTIAPLVDLGLFLNYHYFFKTGSAPTAQVLGPMVALTFGFGDKSSANEAKPVAHKEEVAQKEEEPVDSDGDGVPDSEDRCPNTAHGSEVNSIGCVAEEKAEIRLEVAFESAKAVVRPAFKETISETADLLKKHPSLKGVVEGHSDSSGNAEQNRILSQARAEAVRNALIEEGVEASRLTAKGFGPSQPIADNSTPEGRAQNRRVVLSVQ